MLALVFDGQQARATERGEPVARDGQVIARTLLAGICNTDLEIVRGYMGFEGTLGHEFVARVDEGALKGKRVVGEINFACETCAMCARDLQRHCPNRTVLGILGQDGALAERVALPLANLHEVPDALSDEQAVFVEPLAAAFEIREQVAVAPGVGATVLGDGKLGLLIAQVLAMAGAKVLAVGHHESHLSLLRERGIDAVLEDDWDQRASELVIEATGSASGFAKAVGSTAPRGTLVLKSTVAARKALDLAPLVINEITVVGSRCGPFAPALGALVSGAIEVRPMIEATFALAEGAAALTKATERGALKVLVKP